MIRRLLLVTSLLPWSAGMAQQEGTAAQEATAQEPQQEPQWSIPRRRLDFYAGFRSNGGTDFMIGAKFSRQIPGTRRFAAAAFGEVAFSSPTQYLLGALLQFMPVNRLLVETGPGVVINGGTTSFWRASGEYELQIDRLYLIPKVYFDFVHGTTVFGYGLAIGRR